MLVYSKLFRRRGPVFPHVVGASPTTLASHTLQLHLQYLHLYKTELVSLPPNHNGLSNSATILPTLGLEYRQPGPDGESLVVRPNFLLTPHQ